MGLQDRIIEIPDSEEELLSSSPIQLQDDVTSDKANNGASTNVAQTQDHHEQSTNEDVDPKGTFGNNGLELVSLDPRTPTISNTQPEISTTLLNPSVVGCSDLDHAFRDLSNTGEASRVDGIHEYLELSNARLPLSSDETVQLQCNPHEAEKTLTDPRVQNQHGPETISEGQSATATNFTEPLEEDVHVSESEGPRPRSECEQGGLSSLSSDQSRACPVSTSELKLSQVEEQARVIDAADTVKEGMDVDLTASNEEHASALNTNKDLHSSMSRSRDAQATRHVQPLSSKEDTTFEETHAESLSSTQPIPKPDLYSTAQQGNPHAGVSQLVNDEVLSGLQTDTPIVDSAPCIIEAEKQGTSHQEGKNKGNTASTQAPSLHDPSFETTTPQKEAHSHAGGSSACSQAQDVQASATPNSTNQPGPLRPASVKKQAPFKHVSKRPSQETTLAELKAQRAALLASLATLPQMQELIAENASTSQEESSAEPTDTEVMGVANKIVKKHIKLLHEYNEIKDVGQGLMGLIADQRGVRIVEVQDEFGIQSTD